MAAGCLLPVSLHLNLAQALLLADILADKFLHYIIADDAGGHAGGVPFLQLPDGQVGADDGGAVGQKAGIDQVIDHRQVEGGGEFRPQVVQDEKVAG